MTKSSPCDPLPIQNEYQIVHPRRAHRKHFFSRRDPQALLELVEILKPWVRRFSQHRGSFPPGQSAGGLNPIPAPPVL